MINLTFVLLARLCPCAYGQEGGTEWINRVASAYAGFSSCYFEGIVRYRIDGFGKFAESNSFEQYAKPGENKFRYSAGKERPDLIVAVDGTKTIAYSAGSNQYAERPSADTRTVIESLFKNPSDLYLGPAFSGNYTALTAQIKSARVLRREKIPYETAPVDCIVVEMEVNSEDRFPQSDTIRTLWIDPQRSVVLRDVIHSQTLSSKGQIFIDSVLEVLVSSYRVNEEMEDSAFQFRPPPGARVADSLDLRKHDVGLVIGAPTLGLSLSGLDGRRYSFETLKGSIVVLDFWATWCVPCRKEMKSLEKQYAKYKDQGLALFGINREGVQLQTGFLKKNKFTYPMLLDNYGDLTQRFNAVNLPTLVLIDRKGRIAVWEQGLLKEEEVENLLEHLGVQ